MKIINLLLVPLFLMSGIVIAEEHKYSSEFGIKYDKSKEFPIIIFQDGLFFGEAQALQCLEALSSKYLLPTGIVDLKHNNSSPGMTAVDSLLESTYRRLDDLWGKNNQTGVLVLYMGGAAQFVRAVQVAKLYGRKYANLKVIPIDEDIAPEQLSTVFNESKATGTHPCIKSFDRKNFTELLDAWRNSQPSTSLPSSAQPITPE